MILDSHGNLIAPEPEPPAAVDVCPQCKAECPEGDDTTRRRSGGFGQNVRDLCRACGWKFDVLTVTK